MGRGAQAVPENDDHDYSLEFQDEFSRQSTSASAPAPALTREPPPIAGMTPSAPAQLPPERRRPTGPMGGPPPPLDESVLNAYDDVVEFVTPGQVATGSRRRAEPAAESPYAIQASSPKPDRLGGLFALVQQGAERGDFLAAVQAVEMFLKEDEQLEHLDAREREIFMRVFEAHLGRMDQIPLVAVPMHEIAAANLDHRTGFLLSRIDGMLTYEDILDVAGMPRLEAYRILSNLLRRGFIEVR
jgi:hypothetical protein